MSTIHPVKDKEDWEYLVREHIKSGLSQVEFCRQRNISAGKFGYHRSLLLTKEIPATKDKNLFTAIQIKKPEPVSADIRLILPNGFQCYLPSHIAPAQAKQLLEVLLSC
jgi:hypothetical protein